MADTAHESKQSTNRRGKVIHHGRTPAAWAGSMIAMVAVVVVGIALVIPNWPAFWVGIALLVVAIIVGKVLQAMGYGAD